MKPITAITAFLMATACTGDASEKAPASDVPDDTTGLGALIATHFPGYRLSAEQEIAGRFQLTDGSKPADYYPHWGSGKTWWIWNADTDRDGKEDRIVLLTSAADPAKDLLVALHGNGSAARITEPGGWGVEIENGDVLIVAWEKAADRFRWNGSSYAAVE